MKTNTCLYEIQLITRMIHSYFATSFQLQPSKTSRMIYIRLRFSVCNKRNIVNIPQCIFCIYSLPFNLCLMSSVFTRSQRLLRVCVLLYLDLSNDFRFIIVRSREIAMQELDYTDWIHIIS